MAEISNRVIARTPTIPMQRELVPRKIEKTWLQRYGSNDFKLCGQCAAGERHALKQAEFRAVKRNDVQMAVSC